MKIKHIIFALTCGLALTAGPVSWAESSYKKQGSYDSFQAYSLKHQRYVGGAIISTLSGFGIGHAIQGRYWERGWIFTLGGTLAWGGFVYFAYSFFDEFFLKDTITSALNKEEVSWFNDDAKTMAGWALACLVAYVGVRVWETVDAWTFPSHYRVSERSPVELSPLYAMNKRGPDHFGLSLKYKF